MVLIGLYGGKAASRVCVATKLETHPAARVNVLSLPPIPGMSGEARAAQVAEEGPARARLLETHLARLDRRQDAPHLVITHVESLEEVAAIRARGGVMWFVKGVPSDIIPIQPADLGVSLTPGESHYLYPAEALHQELMTQRQAQRVQRRAQAQKGGC